MRKAWASLKDFGTEESSAAERCSVRHFFVVGGGKHAHVWKGDLLVLPVADDYRQITQKVRFHL